MMKRRWLSTKSGPDMACSALQRGLLIAAQGSYAVVVRMLRAAVTMLRDCVPKVDGNHVAQQSARTIYCSALRDTFETLGSQECAVPLLHNVPLGNVRAKPCHGAELWNIAPQ